MTPDPLSLPATPARLRAAAQAAALSPRALDRALEVATATPGAPAWHRFLSRALMSLGAALVLAGVICFFAYNWDRIGRFGKFALIEAGIVAAALLAWRRLARLSGQVALTAAAVLVGLLLAVYGQTYQTGADPYGLFMTWALLMLPWVIAARFTALWVIEVILVDVTLSLWWSQVVAPPWADPSVATCVIIGLVHALAIAAWEWQIRRRTPWLTEKWAPHELGLVAFASLVIAASVFVVDPVDFSDVVNVAGAIGLAALIASIAAAFWYYRQVRPDRFMVTVAGAAGLALAAVAVGRLLIEDLDLEEFGLLLVGLFVIAEITLGLRWLRQTRPPGYGSEA
ncbi:MAG: DUF2157 domain-containing protein [Gemmatimonadaceae bacterium]